MAGRYRLTIGIQKIPFLRSIIPQEAFPFNDEQLDGLTAVSTSVSLCPPQPKRAPCSEAFILADFMILFIFAILLSPSRPDRFGSLCGPCRSFPPSPRRQTSLASAHEAIPGNGPRSQRPQSGTGCGWQGIDPRFTVSRELYRITFGKHVSTAATFDSPTADFPDNVMKA